MNSNGEHGSWKEAQGQLKQGLTQDNEDILGMRVYKQGDRQPVESSEWAVKRLIFRKRPTT